MTGKPHLRWPKGGSGDNDYSNSNIVELILFSHLGLTSNFHCQVVCCILSIDKMNHLSWDWEAYMGDVLTKWTQLKHFHATETYYDVFFFFRKLCPFFSELFFKSLELCAIFLSKNVLCCNLLSFQMFFGFSIQNYPLKPKTRVKSCFAASKSKKGTFFFSKLWLVIFRPLRERIWKKQLEHRSQWAVTQECLVDLRKCTISKGKKFPCIFQGMKKKTAH